MEVQLLMVNYTNLDGMNESIEGAVISHSDPRPAVCYILKDGRTLVFADCECFAIVFSKEILQ